MENKRIVRPWQAAWMLLVGIAVIIAGLLVMKLNNRIVLTLDGVIMCLMAWCFGIPYAELQQGIKETVSSMIVAILILLSVGVLVGVWMASGTVPVMIYYGMKVLTPGLFLPVVCILCTLMSTMAGTSWGTLATVGVACMGVAQGLGVPLPAAAGAVCTGAFFGDKISPLSDSPVITATVCEVPLMEGIRHALISTGPAYLISLVFFFLYGLRFAGGTVGGQVYEDILATVSAEFWLSPVLLLPVALIAISNFSSALLVGLMGATILFVASPRVWYFGAAIAGAIPLCGLAVAIPKFRYRLTRIKTWLDPWADPTGDGFQTIQSLYALASGGLFGLGLGQSRQKTFIPEAYNDIIFAIICEELGIVGAALVILLFAVLIWRGIRIAMNAKDSYGMLVATGITAVIAFQSIINIGVVTNTIPNTGQPLPFISYGGTSLLFLMAMVGMLLNISRYPKDREN